jgi:hypothetical protein
MKFPLALLLFLLCLVPLLCACASGQPPADAPETAMHTEAADTEFSSREDTEMNTESIDDIAAYRVTDLNGTGGLDFILDFPAGKDLTVLQITDTQMQTMAGVRNENRKNQVGNAFFSALPDNFEFRVWRYMDEAVERTCPDLIVLTGDNIYGELDDSGTMWLALIEKMDSYGIPWCVVFGNHDNESGKGVTWQVEQLLQSEYCIFKQGSVSGNSNYNLLIRQGGEAKYLLYMMDSNGCQTRPLNPGEGMMPDNPDIDKIQQRAGFRNDQIGWMTTSAKEIRRTFGEVPVLMFYHIPVNDIAQIIHRIYPAAGTSLPFSPDKEGDFGKTYEVIVGADGGRFWKNAKSIGCTGMFVGHQHTVATSIDCDGIRVTYGLKTGTYDYHSEDLLGTTQITLDEDSGQFAVEYVYSALSYRGQ